MADRFTLHIHAAVGKAFVPYIRTHLRKAHAILSPPLGELSLALVNDARMADLHVQFMNIPGPTDVLTFPLDEDEAGHVTAGEVVICLPEAKRRAKEHGTELKNELLLYALHGLLHLCGFDDRTDRDFRAMHRAEDDILTQLGVGSVFAADRDRVTPRVTPKKSKASPKPSKSKPAATRGRGNR